MLLIFSDDRSGSVVVLHAGDLDGYVVFDEPVAVTAGVPVFLLGDEPFECVVSAERHFADVLVDAPEDYVFVGGFTAGLDLAAGWDGDLAGESHRVFWGSMRTSVSLPS